MNFDYEEFFDTVIGSGYDNLISSTYFLSGWCVDADDNGHGTDSVDTPTSISTTDIMMGSNMFDEDGKPKYSYNFSGYENEFADTDYGDRYNDMNNTMMMRGDDYYNRIIGSSMEIVDGVMILTANITDSNTSNNTLNSMMGGDGMGGSMVTTTARGKFPDLTTCDGMKFQVMMSSSSDEDNKSNNTAVNWDEFKYRIEFGYKKLPERVFGFGYRADLTMPQQNDDGAGATATAVTRSESLFTDVIIPFEAFTLDWDW